MENQTYYFIYHQEELDLSRVDVSDYVQLNDSSFLCIGFSEWTSNHSFSNNTFFKIEDARSALDVIKRTLVFSNLKQ